MCWWKWKRSLIFYPPQIPTSTSVYSQVFFKFLYFSKFHPAFCSIKMSFTTNQRDKKRSKRQAKNLVMKSMAEHKLWHKIMNVTMLQQYICICICSNICAIYIYIYIYIYNIYIYVYIYMYLLYACIYTHTHIYIYTYIYHISYKYIFYIAYIYIHIHAYMWK